MEIRTQDEAVENIINFAKDLQRLQMQKKQIDDEIKDMKQTWKEEGVAVGKVAKVLNKLKAMAKQSEADRFEEEIIEEKLAANEAIQNNIAVLNAD